MTRFMASLVFLIVLAGCAAHQAGPETLEHDRSGPLVITREGRGAWIYERVEIDSTGTPGAPERVEIPIFPGAPMQESTTDLEGDIPAPDEVITPVWQITFLDGEECFFFETARGLYQAFSRQLHSARRLLTAQYEYEVIWRSGVTDLFRIASVGRENVLGREYEVVEVHHEAGVREPIIYRWAIGLGLIYFEQPDHRARYYRRLSSRTPHRIWENRSRITYRLVEISR